MGGGEGHAGGGHCKAHMKAVLCWPENYSNTGLEGAGLTVEDIAGMMPDYVGGESEMECGKGSEEEDGDEMTDEHLSDEEMAKSVASNCPGLGKRTQRPSQKAKDANASKEASRSASPSQRKGGKVAAGAKHGDGTLVTPVPSPSKKLSQPPTPSSQDRVKFRRSNTNEKAPEKQNSKQKGAGPD